MTTLVCLLPFLLIFPFDKCIAFIYQTLNAPQPHTQLLLSITANSLGDRLLKANCLWNKWLFGWTTRNAVTMCFLTWCQIFFWARYIFFLPSTVFGVKAQFFVFFFVCHDLDSAFFLASPKNQMHVICGGAISTGFHTFPRARNQITRKKRYWCLKHRKSVSGFHVFNT